VRHYSIGVYYALINFGFLLSISSINKKITTYKSDQWYTTHIKTKIKPKDNVQKEKAAQR